MCLKTYTLCSLMTNWTIKCYLNISLFKKFPVILSLMYQEHNGTSKQIETLYVDIGEGNGTPFQYSCLENPMDGGAWWAAVHGLRRVGHN